MKNMTTPFHLKSHKRGNPVFEEFAKKIKTYSIAEPGFSDAIEFADGTFQKISRRHWALC
jgi:hypothetical protein